jgi:hypothetical protein
LTEVKLVNDFGTELQYLLPLSLSELDLASFFEKLETEKANIGIESFGFTAPTLQQIFLTVAPHKELILKKQPDLFSRIKNFLLRKKSCNCVVDDSINCNEESPDDILRPPIRFVENSWMLKIQQCRALFIKRIHVSKRSKLRMFCEVSHF